MTAANPDSTALRDRLTAEQWICLLAPLAPERVNKRDGNDYLEQWDVRRWLTRIFGHGGWDLEVRELTCVREHGVQQPQQGTQAPRWRWWVSYRAQIRLHVRDQWGQPLGYWDGSAADEKANQPGHGDAHHGAMTSAESTALKRAAINLGDAFGLALYSSEAFDREAGKSVPVVGWTAVRPPEATPETSEGVPAAADSTTPEPTPDLSSPAASVATVEDWINGIDALIDAADDEATLKAAWETIGAEHAGGRVSEQDKAKLSKAITAKLNRLRGANAA
jgi:hypothetical protein